MFWKFKDLIKSHMAQIYYSFLDNYVRIISGSILGDKEISSRAPFKDY